MRKITLFAAAALASVAAVAATPAAPAHSFAQTKASAFKAQRIQKAAVSVLANSELQSRAGETVTSGLPLFGTPTAYYRGMSNNLYGATPTTEMMLPARGVTRFVPATEPAFTGAKWNWIEYQVNEAGTALEAVPVEKTADVLLFENGPYLQTVDSVTVTADINGVPTKYANPQVSSILCGRDFASWNAMTEEQMAEFGTFGVSPCAAGPSNQEKWHIWGGFYGFELGQTETDEDGTVIEANEYGIFDSLWSDKFPGYSKFRQAGYLSYLPYPGSNYLLSSVYFLCRAVCSEDVVINVNVYELDAEGEVDHSKLVGKGSAVIAACTEKEPFYDFLTVELSGVNVLGFSTNSPICASNALGLEVTGVENEALSSFYMMVNGNVIVPDADWQAREYSVAYPGHGYSIMQAVNDETKEVESLVDPYIHLYYTDNTMQYLARCSDFEMFYDIYFPVLYNVETGEDAYNVVLPVEGATDGVFIDSSLDIAQLYSDGLITATQNGDWFEYEVGFDEEYEVYYVAVKADALPAGETGRYGEIKFAGYACDFTVTVTQGESGINSVVANGRGVSEFYDLQGRKLNAAPAKGLYIERNGSAAATKLAR